MKRSNFILSLFVGAPFAAHARSEAKTIRDGKGFKISAGEGRYHGSITLKGVNHNILDVKISGKDTNGDLAVFEQTSLSPGRGTPLHIHPKQDEIFYVLQGEFGFKVGDDRHRLKTGDSIFLPRNIPHAWIQLTENGKMTVTLQPAGKLEEFFVSMAGLKQEPTPAEIAKIFADHEMKVLGPQLSATEF